MPRVTITPPSIDHVDSVASLMLALGKHGDSVEAIYPGSGAVLCRRAPIRKGARMPMLEATEAKLVGERITRAREARGLSREKLAQLIGVSRQHLKRWETGEWEPTRRYRLQLAEALDVPVHYFFGSGIGL